MEMQLIGILIFFLIAGGLVFIGVCLNHNFQRRQTGTGNETLVQSQRTGSFPVGSAIHRLTQRHDSDCIAYRQLPLQPVRPSHDNLIMFSVLLITYFLFLSENRIQRWIGNTGAAVISRVMGLILAAVAINNMLVGIRDFFTQMS